MPTSPQGVVPPGFVHSRRAAILMLLGFLATELPMPGNAIALVALVPAAVESVRAVRALSGAGAAHRLTVWSLIGLVLILVLICVVVLTLVANIAHPGYAECLRGANTDVAAAQCQATAPDGLLGSLLTNR